MKSSERCGRAEAPQPNPRTILLVEDDPWVRGVTSRALCSAGYEVLVAKGPNEAIDIFGRSLAPPHLLLTDVVMPRLSGHELAERLRKDRPGLRVLFMSGYSENALPQEGVLLPGVELLRKPFTAAALLERVRDVLDGS